MSLTAIILVTISTFAHATWNLLGKRHSPSAAFFGLGSLAAVITFSPIVIIYRQIIPLIPLKVWVLILITGLCQMVYFIGLAGAYRNGDLSIAYPLARALPAFLVAGVSFILGLGKNLTGTGLVGIFAVVAGCLIIPLRSFKEIKLSNYLNTCCLLAVMAALGTCGYTLIDSEALRMLRSIPGSGLNNTQISAFYMEIETISSTIALIVYSLCVKYEREQLRDIMQSSKLYTFFTGVLITATYGLVLVAMAYVTNVSYIAAFRQLSIPLGALLGIGVQKEPYYNPKLIGIGVVVIGLILVSVV